ncbi:MAG: amidohydrolase, PncC family domain protein [Gammaproteobacteria bacterium]|jgi:nicotinamide-nucleotide amidase|nr:amidohydrolase, PncC family domain protein [Gammaproteobacteria bacterium]
MNIEHIALQLGKLLQDKNLLLATAESCTGGWIAKTITSLPTSSCCLDRGFVTYSEVSKQEMLDVDPQSIEKYGAVSEVVAQQMAEGALNNSHAQVSLAVTGVAGPTQDGSGTPIGTIWFAWARLNAPTITEYLHLEGNRNEVCAQCVQHSLNRLLEILENQE